MVDKKGYYKLSSRDVSFSRKLDLVVSLLLLLLPPLLERAGSNSLSEATVAEKYQVQKRSSRRDVCARDFPSKQPEQERESHEKLTWSSFFRYFFIVQKEKRILA